MDKKILYILTTLLLLCSCGSNDTYVISGRISNINDPEIYAVFEGNDNHKVDTVLCGTDGNFTIKENEKDFREATLFFNNKTKWITVYLEEGKKVKISGDVNYPGLISVTGGQINDFLNKERKKIVKEIKELTDLREMLSKVDSQNSSERLNLTSRISNVSHQLASNAIEVVKNNPNNEGSLVILLRHFTNSEDVHRIDEIMALFDPKMKESPYYTQLKEFVDSEKRTLLGEEAPNFKVNNIYGKPMSLDSFAGKVLLLAFTAPWCDMCHTEDMYLNEMSKKYSNDSLAIMVVSLDEEISEVRRIMNEESVKWNLVADSAAQATQLVNLYNVRDMPYCYVIDEDGKIILKTDNALELKQTIDRLLD